MSQKSDVTIVGAGIVGLATAYQLMRLKPDWTVRVLEKESAPAMHQTGRNSGVVHSGIYYKPGSLKAKNCIAGKKELLRFCDERGVPYVKIHKVIVATQEDEFPRLEEIFLRGQANGVPSIELIGKERLREIEPFVEAQRAIYLSDCHIIDYKKVAAELCLWITQNGGEVLFNEEVGEIRTEEPFCSLSTQNGIYQTKKLINCAGLHSDRLARSALSARKRDQQILPFRGEYYDLAPEKGDLVKGLVYPVPDPKFPFLGVHLTRMVNGKVEAGPNAVLAFAREGYRKTDVNWKELKEIVSYPGFWQMAFKYWKAGLYEMARSLSKQLFLKDLQRLVPAILEKDLTPGGRGIRAQVVTREGKLMDDFAILQEKNTIHVINAPSPAATASLSIGRTIAEMAIKMETDL